MVFVVFFFWQGLGNGRGVRKWKVSWVTNPNLSYLVVKSNTDCMSANLLQWCPTLWDPMDYSLPGSSVHGILQWRLLEWVAISFLRGSSEPRDQTRVSCIAGRFFTVWGTKEALVTYQKITYLFSIIPVLYGFTQPSPPPNLGQDRSALWAASTLFWLLILALTLLSN